MNKNDIIEAFSKIENIFKAKIFNLPVEERPKFTSEAIYDCIVTLDNTTLATALAHMLYTETVNDAYKPLSSTENITFE